MTLWQERKVKCGIMLDDDIVLKTAIFDVEKKRFKRCPEKLEKEFNESEQKCLESGIGFTSFSQEYFNTGKEKWVANQDNAGTYFVNVESAYESGASFLLPSVDDRRFILETIASGLGVSPNSYVSATKLGKHGRGGKVGVGGRGEKHETSLRWLNARYPTYVKLRETKSKAYIDNYGTNVAATFYLSKLAKDVKESRYRKAVEKVGRTSS